MKMDFFVERAAAIIEAYTNTHHMPEVWKQYLLARGDTAEELAEEIDMYGTVERIWFLKNFS